MKCCKIKNTIKEKRILAGIKQEQLANELCIGRTYLSKLENNHFFPSENLIVKLCEFFGCELGELFYIKNIEEDCSMRLSKVQKTLSEK